MYTLVDFLTKKKVTPKNLIFTGKENPWEVEVDLDQVRSRINFDYFKKSPPFNSKYLPLMPIKDYSEFVSVGEGSTPLIKSKKIGPAYGIDLFFKLESLNPTGSFKDRGSAVEITIAKELGAKAVVLASTGNMAASCACYAGIAQIPCFVFVPESTPSTKLAQVISYGGKIVQVKGTYSDAAHIAKEVAEELGFYLAGDYAYRVEGQKTAAYEVIEQMFFEVPDIILVPIGCGTNLAAYMKGFREYQALGLIDRIPRIVGVQATGSQAVVNSFIKGLDTIEILDSVNTIASAIAVTNPVDGVKALEAIYATKGTAIALTDNEILASQNQIAREEGLFIEPSCATAIAALEKLSAEGFADGESLKGKKVVAVLTGSGLKDTSPILKVAMKPPTIAPVTEEFFKLYRKNFFAGKNIILSEEPEILFKEIPTKKEVLESIKKVFNTNYPEPVVVIVLEQITKFLQKGKTITLLDFEDIVQTSSKTINTEVVPDIIISDYCVKSFKDKKALAEVKVVLKGKQVIAEAEGVGPLDAVVNCLKQVYRNLGEFRLEDFKVDIRSEGSDAVVSIETRLSRQGKISVGFASSPDLVQATIESFQSAFNDLRG